MFASGRRRSGSTRAGTGVCLVEQGERVTGRPVVMLFVILSVDCCSLTDGLEQLGNMLFLITRSLHYFL